MGRGGRAYKSGKQGVKYLSETRKVELQYPEITCSPDAPWQTDRTAKSILCTNLKGNFFSLELTYSPTCIVNTLFHFRVWITEKRQNYSKMSI